LSQIPTIKCPSCGTHEPYTASKCRSCGERLVFGMSGKSHNEKVGIGAIAGLAFAALVLVGLLAGLADRFIFRPDNYFSNPGPGSSLRTPEPSRDASAIIACRDFSSAINDVQKGLLTDAEIRGRIKDVQYNAHLADSFEIRSRGESMLRALTIGTPSDALKEFARFAEACRNVRQ